MSIDHRCNNKNKNLPESVVNFLNYLHTIKESSSETVYGYEKDLSMFFRYMLCYKRKGEIYLSKMENINISRLGKNFIQSIKLSDLYAFMEYLQTKEKPNGTSARARKVGAIKSYFKYLHSKEKIIDSNIAQDLESPKQGKREAIAFTGEQVDNIYKALDKNDMYYFRNKCILTMLLNTGIRLSELQNIKINDIYKNKLTIIGKGNKERVVFLNQKCLDSINEYMENRKTNGVDELEKEYLFLSNVKRHLSKSAIEIMMKQLYEKAGCTDKKYVTHTTRHTVGTNIYKKTKDVLMVATVLGHENMNTSRIYITMDNEDIKNVMDSL